MKVVFVASLALNLLALSILFVAISEPKMKCSEAISEISNKEATAAFAHARDGSLLKTHDFLIASDYRLRNVYSSDDKTTFVYVASSYPRTCWWPLPGIDTSIVRVETDATVEPKVVGVW